VKNDLTFFSRVDNLCILLFFGDETSPFCGVFIPLFLKHDAAKKHSILSTEAYS